MTNYNFSHMLTFLDDLDHNNFKAWFDSHRSAYEEARDTFTAFINALIDELRESDHLQDLSAISRYHRLPVYTSERLIVL